MQWDEFITKLRKAKAEKKIVGNVASVFMNLLYSGALDSMLPSNVKPTLSLYDSLLDQILNALKSKASKPKKTKTEMVGLKDVKNDVILGLWRYQNNPLAQFNLKSHCMSTLGNVHSPIMGYVPTEPDEGRGFMKKEHEIDSKDWKVIEKNVFFISTDWQKFFERDIFRNLWVYDQDYTKNDNKGIDESYDRDTKITTKENCTLAIMGVVISKTVSRTMSGKEKMEVVLFTGSECTGPITFWPARGHSDLHKSIIDGIKVMNVYAIQVKLSEYKGRPGASVMDRGGMPNGYTEVFDFSKKEEVL